MHLCLTKADQADAPALQGELSPIAWNRTCISSRRWASWRSWEELQDGSTGRSLPHASQASSHIMPYVSYPRDGYTGTFSGYITTSPLPRYSSCAFRSRPTRNWTQTSLEVKLQLSFSLQVKSSRLHQLACEPLQSASQSAGSMQRCSLSFRHLEITTTTSSYRPWPFASPCVSAGEGWLTTPSKSCLHLLGLRHFQEVLSASCGSNTQAD